MPPSAPVRAGENWHFIHRSHAPFLFYFGIDALGGLIAAADCHRSTD